MASTLAATVAPVQPLRQRYLMVLNIPVFKDAAGACWTDHLWHKDLIEHLEYIDDFTLACPFIGVVDAPQDTVRVDDPRIKFVELPGRRKLSTRLPITIARLWRAVGRAQIVHTGLGGWLPISLCNMTAFMAKLRRRFLLVMVESSPWRLVPGEPASLTLRARALLSEWVNKTNLRSVSMAMFTHARYRDSLLPDRPDCTHVVHASWIDASNILSDEQVEARRSSQNFDQRGPLRVLFAGRVTAAKGVPGLLQALRTLDSARLEVALSVIGDGDLIDACLALQASLRSATIEVLKPVPYGPVFFGLLSEYGAVVVPSVTDEQPRIVYDAFSQGVPVLASDTDGLRECVQDGVTGRLCRPNDAQALADLLRWAVEHREELADMGTACLQRARCLTHREMHRQRWKLLSETLSAGGKAPLPTP